MARSIRSTRTARRLAVAALGVTALTVTAVVAPQVASGTSVTFGFTAAVDGVAGTPLFTPGPAPVDLTLTNPSGSNRRIGLAVYVVPAGLTVGAITNNRSWTTWTTSCGSTTDCSKLVWVWRGSKARLNPGESLTTRVNVTPTGGPGTRTFRVQSLGFDLSSGLFSVSNTASIQVVDPAPTKLELSVDTSPVVAGEPAQVTVTAIQEYAGDEIVRPFPGPITFTTGSGQITSPAGDPGATSPVTLSLTFPEVALGEVLTATSGSLSDSVTLDVVRSGGGFTEDDLVDGKIKIDGPGGTSFTAVLGNGFVGDLEFTEVPCDAIDTELACDTEVNLNGTFKDESGNLYSNENPAQVLWTCPAEGPPGDACPFVAPESSYSEAVQNQWVDFATYKIEVSLKLDDGTYTDFEEAGFCNEKVGDPALGVKGEITWPAAQAPTESNPGGKGFCVDVYGIERAGDSVNGDLTIPVLFVEDPKLRGI
jgi:hypothetical protein